MTEAGKEKAVNIFTIIFLVIITVIVLAALYQAGQAGLLTPDWWAGVDIQTVQSLTKP